MIIFIGSEDQVEELEPDEELVDNFPCMPTQQFHLAARAQLYSLLTGCFLDDAFSLEQLVRGLTDEGPWIYRLDRELVARIAELDEDGIDEFADLWLECEELENLDPEAGDLHEFLYLLTHFCQTTIADDDLDIFVLTDG